MAELLGGGSFVALSHKRRWICLCKRHAGRQSCRLVSASTSCVPQLPWRPPAGRPPPPVASPVRLATRGLSVRVQGGPEEPEPGALEPSSSREGGQLAGAAPGLCTLGGPTSGPCASVSSPPPCWLA